MSGKEKGVWIFSGTTDSLVSKDDLVKVLLSMHLYQDITFQVFTLILVRTFAKLQNPTLTYLEQHITADFIYDLTQLQTL